MLPTWVVTLQSSNDFILCGDRIKMNKHFFVQLFQNRAIDLLIVGATRIFFLPPSPAAGIRTYVNQSRTSTLVRWKEWRTDSLSGCSSLTINQRVHLTD